MAGSGGMRADAQRNRCRIMAAARTLLARRGPEAGMDEIARAAGVAVGTLYRHFPTKGDLVAAAVDEHAREMVGWLEDAVARVRAGAAALDELTALLERFAVAAGEDRALKKAAAALGARTAGDLQTRGMAVVAELVAAAHEGRGLRPDVTAEDLALLVSTIPGDELDPAARRRWLRLMLRGLVVDR